MVVDKAGVVYELPVEIAEEPLLSVYQFTVPVFPKALIDAVTPSQIEAPVELCSPFTEAITGVRAVEIQPVNVFRDST